MLHDMPHACFLRPAANFRFTFRCMRMLQGMLRMIRSRLAFAAQPSVLWATAPVLDCWTAGQGMQHGCSVLYLLAGVRTISAIPPVSRNIMQAWHQPSHVQRILSGESHSAATTTGHRSTALAGCTVPVVCTRSRSGGRVLLLADSVLAASAAGVCPSCKILSKMKKISGNLGCR
jgi:hypothetical protein